MTKKKFFEQKTSVGIRIGWIRIQLFISMRIRIQGAKQMRTHADPDPDPGQTLKSQKAEFFMKNILNVLQ
jgi:hypothetical protein